MSAIRNSSVARGLLNSTSVTVVYTVPASNVLLLKSILLYNNQSSATSASVIIRAFDGSAQVYGPSVSIPASSPYTWDGWVALNAGDTISILASQTLLGYWMSGAILPFNPATP